MTFPRRLPLFPNWAILSISLLILSDGAAQEENFFTPEELKIIREARQKAEEETRQKRLAEYLTKLHDLSDNANQYRYMFFIQELRLPPKEGIPVFTGLLTHPSDVVKQGALTSLAGYGRKAESAYPQVVNLFTDSDRQSFVTIAAANTLVKLVEPNKEKATVSLLVERLQGKSLPNGVRISILEALGQLSSHAKGAVEDLQLLQANDPDPEIRFTVYKTLGKILTAGKVTSLKELNRREEVDWSEAEQGFPFFDAAQREREKASGLIPRFLNIIEDGSPMYLRALAIEAIGLTGGGGKIQIVYPLLNGIDSERYFLSQISIKAVDRLDQSMAPAVKVFAAYLKHPNPEVRLHAAAALYRVGPAALDVTQEIVDALLRADGKTSLNEIGYYLDTLKKIASTERVKAPLEVAERLSALLSERHSVYDARDAVFAHRLRAYVLHVVTQLGLPAEAMPHVLEMLTTFDRSYARGFAAAAAASSKLSKNRDQAAKALAEALQPDFPDARVSFESFFSGHLVPDEGTTLRLEALRALRELGLDASTVLPALKTFLVWVKAPSSHLQSEYRDRLITEATQAIEAIQSKE